jgi:hypothetical protein
MRALFLLGLVFLPVIACGGTPNTETPETPETRDAGADAPAPIDASPPQREEISLPLLGANEPVEGFVEGRSFTITSYPKTFVAAFTVGEVQRLAARLRTSSEIEQSCAKPLNALDVKSPPLYAAELLLNPLAEDVLLDALRADPVGKKVAYVTNPLKLEKVALSDTSFQEGVPASVTIDGSPGLVRLPTGHYSWGVLCSGIKGEPMGLTATLKGKLGATAFEGSVEFTSIVVSTAP